MRQASEFVVHPKAQDYYLPGDKNAVLLTHGFTGSPYDLHELADVLHALGSTVLVKRLAGHGTDPHDLALTTSEDWQRSLDEAVGQLGNIRSLLLVGNSFGGNLLIDLSQRTELPVCGIVLLSTPLITQGEWWKRLALPVISSVKFSVKKPWIKNEGEAQFIEKGSYTEIPLKSYKQFLDFLHKRTKAQIRQVTDPIMFVYSRHDTVIKPKSAEKIFDSVRSVDKSLYWVDDTYHSPLGSAKKTEIFDKIVAFYLQRRALLNGKNVVL